MQINKEKQILICEDDDGILEVVKIVLEENGYKVIVLNDSSQVESKAIELAPDLILIDLWMPEMNGDEVTRRIKQNEKVSKIPVIIMSANKDIEKITQDIGAQGCIPKPFDIVELENVIVKILG